MANMTQEAPERLLLRSHENFLPSLSESQIKQHLEPMQTDEPEKLTQDPTPSFPAAPDRKSLVVAPGRALRSAPQLRIQPPTPGIRPFVGIRLRKRTSQIIKEYFKDVSDEMILSIFQWLPKPTLVKCALVSRKWKRLAFDESLWKRVDLGGRIVRETELHAIITRGALYLRVAKADLILNLTPANQSSLVLYPQHPTSRLAYLDLSLAVYSSPNVISGVLERCQSLIGLSLEFGEVNDRACAGIGQNTNLQFLNLAQCKGLTGDGLEAIVEGCGKLLELNVAWTGLSPEMASLLCLRLPSALQRLNISGCRSLATDDPKNFVFTNTDVDNLMHSCPNLIELDIQDCTRVTSVGLDSILAQSSLHLLSTSRCYEIEPLCYTLCKDLRVLNIHGCVTDDGLAVLRDRLKGVLINDEKFLFSTIARPTVGIRRTSIWTHRVRDAD